MTYQESKENKSAKFDGVVFTGICHDELKSVLTIRDVSKDVLLPLEIGQTDDGYNVKGSLEINWAEYGIEDPSILIASVDPVAKIDFAILLKEDR